MSEQEIVQLPLSSIVIGRYQTRKQNVGKEIEALAESIRIQGLMQPITVCVSPDEPESYEVIAGQRRFLAHQVLQAETIPAIIVETPDNDIDGKVLSLTENFLQEDPTAADYVDICTELYLKYGDLKEIQRRTGLPIQKVRLYVKFDRLADELKNAVKHEGVDLKVALKAQDAALAAGNDVEKAVALAREMMKLSNPQREKAARAVEESPQISVEQAVDVAKAPVETVRLAIDLQKRIADSLNSYANKEGTNSADAATSFVVQGLLSSGFLADQEV